MLSDHLNSDICQLIENRNVDAVPIWDSILRSQRFDVAHAYNTSLPGLIVVITKRHIAAIDEMTEEESIELGRLIRKVSIGLKQAVSCRKSYVLQFAEKEGHSHVHFHIVPRMEDLADEHKGANIFHYLGVDEDDRVTEAQMNEIGEIVRSALAGEF